VLPKLFRLLKLIVYWIDHGVFTLIMYLLTFLPRALLARFYPRLFRLWSMSFVHALDVDLRLLQNHRKPLPEHFLMIGNHPSAFEDIGIPALFDVASVAKHEVKDWWIVGRISAAAGTLFVVRDSKDSRTAVFQQVIDELGRGKNIALYPEGGCKGRAIAPFRYGVFDISLQTGIPIVPVFLHYEAQDVFEWRAPQTLLNKIWHFLTSPNNRANYYVFDAIDPRGFDSKEDYCDHVHKLYLQWQTKYLE
jgi:1-acyl-sn-glycerol-3-phosphate acyltransferase